MPYLERIWQGLGTAIFVLSLFVLSLSNGCRPAVVPTPPIRASQPVVLSTKPAVAGSASSPVADDVSVKDPAAERHDEPAAAVKPPVETPDEKVAKVLRDRGARVNIDQRSGKINHIFAGRVSSPGSKVKPEDVVSIGTLSGVSMLYLDGTNIQDADVLKLSGLRGIISFDVSGNDITDKGLSAIKQYPSLDILNISSTKVADETICAVAKTARWRAFWANDSLVTDKGAECLSQIRSLMHVHLAGTHVSNVGLAHLGQLGGLLELNLARTDVNDDGLAHLGRLSRLRELDLSGCAIEGPGLVNLHGLPLQWLKLNDTPLTDVSIAALTGLSKGILVIELRGTKLSPEGLMKIKQAFPDSSIRHEPAMP